MGQSTTPQLRIISWNLTIRCPLKCPHCYSDAGTRDVSDPLSTTEAFGILDQIKATGNPVVILSGGEPMMREDIFEIARYGTGLGLKMAMGTSGYLFDDKTIQNLKKSGISSVAFSIDSADPVVHDSFRGSPGAWNRAVNAIRSCVGEGIGVQINMTIIEPDPLELDRVVAMGKELGVHTYQIFIPVPTGRSMQENYERYGTYEELLKYIIRRYADDPISLRPTCIPQFRRVAEELGVTHPRWGRGCLAGITYCRIYANGDVTPCPYLPAIAGNLRETPLSELWAGSEVFQALRDYNRLQGKCGICEYKTICGGCRARAFSEYGTMVQSCGSLVRPKDIEGELCAEDPLCPYQPKRG
ncbi:radical SAM protein [Methanospirillum sp. J.3.6.1-F.2.7.3]|uniref:Radical SAM protein n=1 Tax=Methanospirillum purgamenti TaxID=2834276 RepID=A0A8E7AYR1_9EURY|nr:MULTISPECIES: radical SAM protein [Methanospirillum]MDX8550706.1 radical SAM protein [Methanospirillum hungatei]QVV90262.1 radical SAM protein [Methanospirillum sp. J.3.6.1-F.2.7.3]